MKSEHETLELIRRHIDGEASEADRKALQEQLRSDPAARRLFARYANIDATLGGGGVSLKESVLPARPMRAAWLSWRPLTAVAAGLAIGIFSASLVYGMRAVSDVVRHRRVAIAEAGFEGMKGAVTKGFPGADGTWTADDAEVLPGPDGGQVLALRPWAMNPYSRVVQIVDVSGLNAEGERELVLAASFRTSDTRHASRYKLRLFAFEESADAVPPFPLETKERGIVTLSQVLDVPAGSAGWQRFSTKMPLPAGVKSVVLWIGASTRPQPGPKVVHFVDDVTLTLDVHQPAAR